MIDDRPHPPIRQVRATFDDTTLIVYQAYPPQIADAALAAGTFVPPFKLDRMTWIKPSFLWMMYRSGWAARPGQERILAIRITRAGFEHALSDAWLSHHIPGVHSSHDDWRSRKRASTVRVQWDPERSLYLAPLPWRAIQVGLSDITVHRYVSQWITDITDITQTAHELRRLLREGESAAARALLRVERPYPLPLATAKAIGATDFT